MLFYIVLFIFSSIGSFIIGVYSLIIQPKSQGNIFFTIICTISSFWCLCYSMILHHPANYWVWYQLSSLAWLFMPAILFNFFLTLKPMHKMLWLRILAFGMGLLFYLPLGKGAFIVKEYLVTELSVFEMLVPVFSFWHALYIVYIAGFILGGLADILVKAFRKKQQLLIKQYTWISISSVFFLSCMCITNVIFPAMQLRILPALAPVFLFFWILTLFYFMKRCQFLSYNLNSAAPLVLHTVNDGILLCDEENTIVDINKAAEIILAKNRKDLISNRVESLFPHITLSYENTEDPACSRKEYQEIHWALDNAAPRILACRLIKLIGKSPAAIGFAVVLQDITQIRETETQLRFLASHDSLTQLPNRFLLVEHLKAAIERARRNQTKVAILLIDLDEFKTINNIQGHALGDQFLKEIALRLSHVVRKSDSIARMEGDEFIIILEGIEQITFVSDTAQRILDAIRADIPIAQQQLACTASIGISIFPEDGDSAGILLQCADTAMYKAKENGKDSFLYSSALMQQETKSRIYLEQALRKAVADFSFELYYQPIFDIPTRQIISLEALIRWNHPQLGSISPNDFIPAAERMGLIFALGEWVLKTACAQNAAWQKTYVFVPPVAVNLSAKQFLANNLFGSIQNILNETGLTPQQLHLEITETTAIKDIEASERLLTKLTELGITIILDDFGIGHASLRWLKKLPIQILKIDRYFIKNITNPNDSAIVKAIIAMANSLNIEVVAEGVETQEQLDQISQLEWIHIPTLRCRRGQGFYFSHPLTADRVTQFFKKQISH